jgi:RNA polymerase sigma-70 factor (ECF subfamily)
MDPQSKAILAADPTDEELLNRLTRGEEQAFVALYRRRHGAIYRFALRVSGSKPVAEDVTQEVFMSLMNGNLKFDPARGSFSAYLYGIARHHLFRRLEQDRSYLPMNGNGNTSSANQEAPRQDIDPLGNLTREELIGSIRQAVASLPLHYREVVVLCDLEELSYGEAAEAIGCPEGTIRSRLNRARTLLLNKLNENGKNGPSAASIQPARCYI